MTAPWVPSIRPEVVTGGAAPDPLALLLQSIPQGMEAGLTGYREQQQNSRSSAELEIQKQQILNERERIKLAQKQQETAQANIEHQREIAGQSGEAVNQFIQALLPQWQMNGALQGIQPQHVGLPQPTDQFGIPQGLPMGQAAQQPAAFLPGGGGVQAPPRPLGAPVGQSQPQGDTGGIADPFAALAALHGVNPEAVGPALERVLPILAATAPKEVDLGDKIGLMDRTGNIIRTIPKGISPEAQARIDLSKAQIAATNSYRMLLQGDAASRQFDSVTKDLRSRAQMVQQAVLTVHQAQFAQDPEQRKVLTSSAIANFVQASDQKANLRYQMLQFFKKNVDPSFKGSWENAANLLATGQYPNKIYSALENHLTSLLSQTKTEYQQLYNGEVKRHPAFANLYRTPDEIFLNNAQTTDPTNGMSQRPPMQLP